MDALNANLNEKQFPEYKGKYYQNDTEEDPCHEFNAHFSYKELCIRLEKIKKEQDNEYQQSIFPIGFNDQIPQLSKQSFIKSYNKKESRNKNTVAPFRTAGINANKYTKERKQSVIQKTSALGEVPSVNMAERIKKIKKAIDVKNMTFKHFILPTNTITKNNLTNKENNHKTRNTLQSIKLIKDYTLQDLTGAIQQNSRNRSRNNKDSESHLLFSQAQGLVVQHSSNEVGMGNGSNTTNNNSNILHTSNNKQSNYSKLITNKKSRNTLKGQLCLSNTHTTNENKSGGTNKTNKTVHTQTNNNNKHKKVKTDSFGTQQNFRSLNDNSSKQPDKRFARPKVVSISNLKATANTVLTTNQKASYNNANNNLNINNTNENASFSINRLNKTSNQNSFISGKNNIMKKYQKEITGKALKLLLLTNNSNQVTKKELSITKENKNNISSSLSQEKLKKTKSNYSNTNTNSVLYNSSINDSKYSFQQPVLNNPNNSKNTNLNSYFTTNNTSNKNNNTSTSSNKTPIVAGQNQNSISLNNQLTSILNKTQSKSIGRIHNYKACSFKYNNIH